MSSVKLTFGEAYDRTNTTIGIEIIAQFIQPSNNMLNIGCRTGNYLEKFSHIVNEIVGIDTDDSMVELAKIKLQNHGNVKIFRCDLRGILPFENESFDVILINQVLWELEENDFDNFPRTLLFCREVSRILKPGGYVCFNTCLPEQVNGFWYMDLVPRIKEECARRYIPLQKLAQYLGNTGFHNQFRGIPSEETLQGLHYFNLAGILDPVWRAGDNRLNKLTEEELVQIGNNLAILIKEGKLGAYFDERDKFRRERGQTIFVIGQKQGVKLETINVNTTNVNTNNIKVI
jgi:SAM-dependent methyltransferase